MTASEGFNEIRRGVFPRLLRETYADACTSPFWEAAKEKRLVMQCCSMCGTFRMPPAPICYNCQSNATQWTELAGTGTVYSYTVVRHPLHPDLSNVVPYVSGVVELDGTQGEGARMLVNIIDCKPEDIGIGARVEIVFDQVDDEMPTPRFRPTRETRNKG